MADAAADFYSDRPTIPAPKPIIVTSPLEKTSAIDNVEPAKKTSQQRVPDVKKELPREKVASEIEPAITDFQGADFNFFYSRELIDNADFEEMAQLSTPVKDQIFRCLSRTHQLKTLWMKCK